MRRFAMYAATLAMVPALAGCGGDPEPRFTPSEPASPTSSPKASAEPEDVVKTWVAARNEALDTGDISEAESLTSDACKQCDEYLKGIEDIVGAGGSIDSSGWTVNRVRLDGDRSKTRAPVVVARVVRPAGSTTASPGATPFEYPRQVDDFVFDFRQEGGEWLINDIYLRG